MPGPVLRLDGITKRFGALVANDAISLELGRGEVLALLGENGAGKSTLVSILFGHYVADAGTVEVFGERLPPGQPRAALAAGVGMVHQHFTLADNATVLENVVLGTEPLFLPFSRTGAARARIRELSARFGLVVDPDARVGDLSVGERQRVEILKALYRGARILVLDEPTSVLTPQEAETLFATLRELASAGLSILFISHKLAEVMRTSTRIAVLRGGRLVAEREAAATSQEELARLMVGREVTPPTRARRTPGAEVLRLEGVAVRTARGRHALRGVDLSVRAGEVVAIAGVAGNGQDALAEVVGGGLRPDAGRVLLAGRSMTPLPRDWVEAGVARVPEDRNAVGVVGDLPVWENAIAERLGTPAFSRSGFVRRGSAQAFTRSLVERFDVRLRGIDTPARSLSGGNLQKLILGRALSVRGEEGLPVLVVASQPTWGLDVGAVADVHRRLLDAAGSGAAVLLLSEDLDEILAIADTVAVIQDGRLGVPRPVEAWTLEEIGLAMAGTQEGGRAARAS